MIAVDYLISPVCDIMDYLISPVCNINREYQKNKKYICDTFVHQPLLVLHDIVWLLQPMHSLYD